MISKQNLWFLTLFSLILILGVYYVTMPNDLLEKIKETTKEKPVIEVIEDNALTAMRVNLEENRQQEITALEKQLTDEKLTTEEKNNVYEQLKYLNEVQSKEEQVEKKIKKEYDLDCFTKIESKDINIICISDNHDKTLANNIMRLVQNNYENHMNIIVKFQKK